MSGLAGGGKTALLTQIAFNMARIHQWQICLASFEMHVRPGLESMLFGFYHLTNPRPRSSWTQHDYTDARAFVEEYFTFIALAPHDDETEADIDWVLGRATDSVMRDGSNMLVLDPWNEVEHKRRQNENVADYTNRAIRHMKRFAHSYNVCTTVVAHPTKEGAKLVREGSTMGLYDISDGATWANKAELGLIVHRKDPSHPIAHVGIRKVKFHETGQIGDVCLTYDQTRRAFLTRVPSGPVGTGRA
jgi:twinkle protein